jgi:hypothetical protein
MSFSNDWSMSVDPFNAVVLITHPPYAQLHLLYPQAALFVALFVVVCTRYLFVSVVCLVFVW